MKCKKCRTATRYRAAVLLLLMGLILPNCLFQRAPTVPEEVERLLAETGAGQATSERLAFIRAACGTVGQVSYFWGGKSSVPGWNREWGLPRQVTAPGSATTGQIRPYGLDCSGLVSWAAVTAWGDVAGAQVGEGVRAQYSRCRPVAMPEPGDLAFFPDLSHVGIVLGEDREGTLWVVHCSASLGGVVVTPATVGFSHYGVPPIFQG